MITALDHIAVVVSDLEEGIRRFLEDFGLEFQGREDIASEQTSTAFFPLPGTSIELLHPIEGQGVIQRALEKRGAGLHHICFRSDDIDADVRRLRAKGYRFLTPEPFVGAHNSRVIFVHPKSCDGVLIELTQPAAAAAS